MVVDLSSSGYRVRIDPDVGGAVLTAEWTRPDGSALPVLEPRTEALAPFRAGCFPMIPFANRINHGRFSFGGQTFQFPVNHPEEDMAVHGFSRERPWQVGEQTGDRVVLTQIFEADGNPYRYRATQEIGLSKAGIRVAISVRNEGNAAMPFGIGLHPWFPKTAQTTLAFRSAGVYARDARGLPVAPLTQRPEFDPAHPAALGQHPWFDGCFKNWSLRSAIICWLEHQASLTLTADGALRHLHVFVPDNRPIVCAEPVSHLPDAINRPELGADCAMDVLQPGEMLSGTMTLSVTEAPNSPEVRP
ncbi:aldose 1-epimerase [Mesorhizobium sp. BE184]|uniref:aldose 1-epimerase n=1 Tax=Mesorhizobium sp. BE184 TaxID=2817714 RepID=UPI0028566D13|nr:aldose 1-epimerase [Mesorhizobium sp. BE184]MDR7032305.1 aldose 1-epimerase [Mesorhizobium sp. BE184]